MPLAPRVAVVIPCRDDADFLEACLTALDAQDRPADRVIVIDNGSTDASASVARAHGAEVFAEDVVGIWPAAAHGYDEAARDCDIIARVDADSRPHPDWISRIVRAFVADSDLGALTGSAEFYGAGPLVRYLGAKWYIGGMYFWVTPWLGHPPVFGSNFAMRSALWARVRDEVDRSNADIHDDLDLSIHLRRTDGIRYDPTLRMPVSARPFATHGALWRRVGRVIPTFAASWPAGAAWRREREPLQLEEHRQALDEGDDWVPGFGR